MKAAALVALFVLGAVCEYISSSTSMLVGLCSECSIDAAAEGHRHTDSGASPVRTEDVYEPGAALML
jgi:hypothetical protein